MPIGRLPRLAAVAVVVAALLLAACGQRGATPVASGATASGTTDGAAASRPREAPAGSPVAQRNPYADETTPRIAETAPVDTRVLDVKLSDAGDGKRLTGAMTDRFGPHDGVFVAIRTRGTARKYTLASRWLDPAGKVLTEYSQNIDTPGEQVTIFSLSKPDGWAPGRYRIELSINGKAAQEAAFSVH